MHTQRTQLVSTTLGTMAALFLTRVKFPGRSLMRAYFLAPLMLPGVVLGLALYVFYVVTNIGLARTLPGMVIGHVLVTVPYVVGTVSAALYNFDLSLEDALKAVDEARIYLKICTERLEAARHKIEVRAEPESE